VHVASSEFFAAVISVSSYQQLWRRNSPSANDTLVFYCRLRRGGRARSVYGRGQSEGKQEREADDDRALSPFFRRSVVWIVSRLIHSRTLDLNQLYAATNKRRLSAFTPRRAPQPLNNVHRNSFRASTGTSLHYTA